MYNDTMDMKWKDAMKAHGILEALQHRQNTVKRSLICFVVTPSHSSHPSPFIMYHVG